MPTTEGAPGRICWQRGKAPGPPRPPRPFAMAPGAFGPMAPPKRPPWGASGGVT
jgi:hypothetical protein